MSRHAPRTLKAAARLAASACLLGALLATGLSLTPGVAGAAPVTSLLYSTDGGATWAANPTVAPGSTVLVRQWFDNTGTDTVDGAAAQSTLPADLHLVAGSTKVCLNPSTTSFTSPTSTERSCVASDESSVWSGQNLAVSPTAGHFGGSAGATSGPLAAGRKRYFNLQQCVSWYTADTTFDHTRTEVDLGGAGYTAASNVGPSADTAPTCAADTFTLQPAMSGVTPFALFDRRYLNLRQCRWVNGGTGSNARALTSVIGGTADPSWGVGSTMSDTAGGTAPCASTPNAGWTLTPDQSGEQAFDVLENRYLVLQDCWVGRRNGYPSSSLIIDGVGDSTWDAPSSATDNPTGGTCPFPFTDPGILIGLGPSVGTYDLLDTTRAKGYVEYSATVASTPSPAACANGTGTTRQTETQVASLSAPSNATVTSNGSVTIDWSQLTDPCSATGTPMVDPLVGGGAAVGLAAAAWFVTRRRGARLA